MDRKRQGNSVYLIVGTDRFPSEYDRLFSRIFYQNIGKYGTVFEGGDRSGGYSFRRFMEV